MPSSPRPGRRAPPSAGPALPPSGAATRACSSTPTAIPGRSPTTPDGPWRPMGRYASTDRLRRLGPCLLLEAPAILCHGGCEPLEAGTAQLREVAAIGSVVEGGQPPCL